MDKIEFIPVKSSQIKAIGHDKEQTLFVKFKKEVVYSYFPVNEEKYLEFKNSESIGSYFHKNLKMNKDLVIQNKSIVVA